MGIGAFDSRTAVQSFTPVRRSATTLNPRQGHVDLQKEWTTARCHRLLRALTSRVEILKRELSRFPSTAQVCSSQTSVNPAVLKTESIQTFDNSKATDMHWTRTRKRIRRKYSGRGGGRENGDHGTSDEPRSLVPVKGIKLSMPGEILVPTPILIRARGEYASEQNLASSFTHRELNDLGLGKKRSRGRPLSNENEKHFSLSETSRGLRARIPASRYTIYEGIYNGLDALLKATTEDEAETTRKGSKSLLSMCLKAVPRYISEEEKFVAAHTKINGDKSAINIRDISTEIYDDLETFGSSRRGWKHLRCVVRSHGIEVINDAIRGGLFDIEFCGALVTLCGYAGAAEEAENLTSALLSADPFPRPRTIHSRFSDDAATRPLSILGNIVDSTGRFSYQYRQLSAMIATRLLPLSWLATKEFSAVWTRAIQALSDSANVDAVAFIAVTLPLLAGTGDLNGDGGDGSGLTPSDLSAAIKETFSSLLTTLCTIIILSRETAGRIRAEESRAVDPEYEHIVELLRSCLAYFKYPQDSNIQQTLLVVANLAIESQLDCPDSNLGLVEQLLKGLKQLGNNHGCASAPYNDLVVFVCSIARCCGRGASNNGFQYLEHIHQILANAVSNRMSDACGILHEIIVDSAIAFAQQAPDRQYLEYAANMDAKFHGIINKAKIGPTVGNFCENLGPGYRWEEGISEWVTATPALYTIKCKNVQDYYSTDESEFETPFRSPKTRRKLEKDGSSLAKTEPALQASRTNFLFDSRSKRASVALQSNGGGLLTNVPSASSRLSSASHGNREPKGSYWSVYRAPTLRNGALRRSQDWQLFDESDDELSLHPVLSQKDCEVLRDVANKARCNNQRHRPTKSIDKQNKSVDDWGPPFLEDSDDELCV